MIHGTRGDWTLVHVDILDTCTRGNPTRVRMGWTQLHVAICTRGTRGSHGYTWDTHGYTWRSTYDSVEGRGSYSGAPRLSGAGQCSTPSLSLF